MNGQSSDMAMPTQDEQTLVAELTRDVLSDTAPEEVELFETDQQGWLDGTKTQSRGRDEMLGFGAEVAILLTPYVISALTAAVRYLVKLFADCATAELQPRATEWVRDIFGLSDKRAATKVPVAVPPDIARKVRELTKQTCLDKGLAEADAALISDAVAGRLVLPA